MTILKPEMLEHQPIRVIITQETIIMEITTLVIIIQEITISEMTILEIITSETIMWVITIQEMITMEIMKMEMGIKIDVADIGEDKKNSLNL